VTLITNEIYALDGFRKTLMVFAADRRLTLPDGSYAGTQRKLFQIPYLEGGISYFGLAEVHPKGKKQYLSLWLRDFINAYTATKTLRDFAFELRNELHRVIPARILERTASGFHICGYNAKGLPEFWYLSNIGGMEAYAYKDFAARYAEPTSDLLDRDARLRGWDGADPSSVRNTTWIYRNGDFRSHVIAFERLDQVLVDMLSFPDFSKPKKPEDWVRFKFEFVAYFYKKFAKGEIIGKPIDAFSLTKTLP
jgi:hypothetical protein